MGMFSYFFVHDLIFCHSWVRLMCLTASTLIRDCEDRNVVFRWSTEMIYPWHHWLGPAACAGSSVYRCSCHALTAALDCSLTLVLIIGKVNFVTSDANVFIKIVKVRETWRRAWDSLFFWTWWCLGKGTAIPLQAWTGPEGSRTLRLPDFKTIGTGRLYPPENIPGTHFCYADPSSRTV